MDAKKRAALRPIINYLTTEVRPGIDVEMIVSSGPVRILLYAAVGYNTDDEPRRIDVLVRGKEAKLSDQEAVVLERLIGYAEIERRVRSELGVPADVPVKWEPEAQAPPSRWDR